MAALVSVVVPVYNTVSYLRPCVQSVLDQTHADFELILVDDGSGDGSGELCDQLGGEDARIRVFHQAHKGVSAARNTALRALRGHSSEEYLFFLDSDDSIHPELLERLCALAEKTNAAIVSSGLIRVAEGDPIPDEGEPPEREYTLLSNQEALNGFWSDKSVMSVLGTIGGKLLRRDAADGILFDEAVDYGEDTKFLYQLLARGADTAILRRKWYYYRQRRKTVSAGNAWKMDYDRYQCYKYLSRLELTEGRRETAEKAERYAIGFLTAGYRSSRSEPDKQAVSFWKELWREERRTPEYALLGSTSRRRFFLQFRCYPLYHLVHCAGYVLLNWKRGARHG